jgi:hypothetical protein
MYLYWGCIRARPKLQPAWRRQSVASALLGMRAVCIEERSVFMPEYGYFCMCCREMHIPGYACVESTRYVPAPTPAPKNREGETDTGGGRDEQC